MKLDLENAYDKVKWMYMRLLMDKIGMRVQVVNWIMGCISSPNFAVLINVSISKFVYATRGLRQGCLMSSLLLLSIEKGLRMMIKGQGMYERGIC